MSHINAYGTKILRNFDVPSILNSIARAEIIKPCYVVSKQIKLVIDNQDVNPFQYPVYDAEHDIVYIDARQFTRMDQLGKLKVINQGDYDLYMQLAKMELAWCKNDRPESAYLALNISNGVMSKWLSDKLSHINALPLDRKFMVKALVAMFSVGQFYNDVEGNATDKYLDMIKRNVAVPGQVIDAVAASVDNHIPRDMDEFSDALKMSDISPRFKSFNPAQIYNTITSDWRFNVNSSLILAVAVEYPPAFAALVSTAIDNTLYKRCPVGEVVYQLSKRDFEQHKRAVRLFIDKFVSEDK